MENINGIDDKSDQNSADLSIVQIAEPSIVIAGQTLTYTVLISNTGPSDAENVMLTDTVPPTVKGVKFYTNKGGNFKVWNSLYWIGSSKISIGGGEISKDDGITWSPWSTPYSIGTVTSGGLRTILIRTKVSSDATRSIVSTATVTSSTIDPNTSNNTSRLVTTVIRIDKSVNKRFADIGEVLTYKLTIYNTGDEYVNNIFFIDSIPEGTTYNNNLIVSTEYIGVNPQSGLTITTIKPNEIVTIGWQVKIENTMPNSNIISNTGTVSILNITQAETNTVTTQINHGEILPQNAIKYADKDITTPGDIVTYTITAKNTGNITINNVKIKDVVPLETNFVSGSVVINGIVKPLDNPNVGISVGNIMAEDNAVISFKVTVGNKAINMLSNKADIYYSYIVDKDTSPVNKLVTTNLVNIKVNSPELTLIKSVDKKYVVVDETVSYTIVVKNTGNVDLNEIFIFDILSPSLEFVDESIKIDGISYKKATIVNGVDIWMLPSGTSKTITFKAKVISGSIKPICNTSKGTFKWTTLSGVIKIGDSISNEVKIYPEFVNIQVEKSSDKEFVVLKDKIIYIVKLKNTGNLDASNVIFKDDLPDVISIINGTFKVNGIVINGVDISKGINIGKIKVGKQIIVQYTAIVVKSNQKLQIINTASVKFQYELYDGSIGSAESKLTPESTNIINMGIVNFKRIGIDEILEVPSKNLDMEEINGVNCNIKILKTNIIKTPTITSNEGQILTGYKLIIHGVVDEIIEYTASDFEQTVHSAHYTRRFSTFIILPENYCGCGNVEISSTIQDIYFKKLDCRSLFINATILIKASVCL